MNRDEFMRELEYLLADIPDEEKADAIEYYRDYLEEAGPEKEEEVIRDFGSPERIAAIIRSDIAGAMEDGGEFTENGYEDGRFKESNFQMAKRYDLPEVTDNQQGNREAREKDRTGRSGSGRTARIVVWILLIIVASPVLLGIGGGALGVAGGLLGCLAALVVTLGAVTGAVLLAGIAMILAGIVAMVVHPLSGLLILGLGICALGLGILGLALCKVFYGRCLPFLFRSVINVISSFVHGRRSRS